jgi:thiopurine S-methyltransferase
MEASFWHQRWENQEIAFHEKTANPLLTEHFQELSLTKGSRVFVPLCGKSLDIHWLLSSGYKVAGVELSKIAIDQLFNDLGLKPNIIKINTLEHYSATNIDIFVGDIFHLTTEILGKVDGVYDRAALVALPETMRSKYTKHLLEITRNAPQLLICFEYEQSLMNGPPFSINDEEVGKHYKGFYEIVKIQSKDLAGGLRGTVSAIENAWHLERR